MAKPDVNSQDTSMFTTYFDSLYYDTLDPETAFDPDSLEQIRFEENVLAMWLKTKQSQSKYSNTTPSKTTNFPAPTIEETGKKPKPYRSTG
jgi:hypothetical protein